MLSLSSRQHLAPPLLDQHTYGFEPYGPERRWAIPVQQLTYVVDL